MDWDSSEYPDFNFPATNICRNPAKSNAGIMCPAYLNPETNVIANEGCGIPSCSDLKNGLEKQQCVISSSAPPNDWGVESDYSGKFYINAFDIVDSPRHGSQVARTPHEIRFELVNAMDSSYKIIRTAMGNCQKL